MLEKFVSAQTDRWMKLVAVLAWLGFGCLAFAIKDVFVFQVEILRWSIGLFAYCAFGTVLWRLVCCQDERESMLFRLILTSAMIGLIFILAWVLPGCGAVGMLLIIPAAVLARLLQLPLTIFFIAVQSIAFATVLLFNSFWNAAMPWILGSTAFQFLAMLSSFVAAKESQARIQLVKLNTSLQQTRALLAETSRAEERLRIAQELHDALGHHLTVLKINLEIATHSQNQNQTKESLLHANSIAHILLQELRTAVYQMQQPRFDLAQALRQLIQQLPHTNIQFVAPQQLIFNNNEQTQTAFRCAQEMLTNSIRHAQAKQVWLELQHQSNELTICCRDDGVGIQKTSEGNGLRGMRQRLNNVGGQLSLENHKGGGFLARAWIPMVYKT